MPLKLTSVLCNELSCDLVKKKKTLNNDFVVKKNKLPRFSHLIFVKPN